MKNQSAAPWICAGDFNEVAKEAEKLGGRTRPHGQMQAFRDIIDECGFMDLGFVGSKFTWHKHFDNYTVWERLDRAMATNDWFSKFSNTKIYHLDVTTSDHKPLWIVPEGMECKQKWPFRFEQMWISESGCGETIEAVWQGSNADSVGRKILKKIETCGTELTKWSKNNFGNVRRELEKKCKLLTQAKRVAINGGSVHTLKKLEQEINVLMDRESKLWRQRAKIQWLKDRDRNTIFFHSKASQRRRKNYIKGLYNHEGQWNTHPGRIADTILQFYQDLFTTSGPDSFEEILEQIPQVVSAYMNQELTREFMAKEIEIALKQMAPLKSPGPNAMPPLFYQNY